MGKREETALQDEDEILGFEKILVLIIGRFVLSWVEERLKLFGPKGTGQFRFATVLSTPPATVHDKPVEPVSFTRPNRFRRPFVIFLPRVGRFWTGRPNLSTLSLD
jgi:hypothetical protein